MKLHPMQCSHITGAVPAVFGAIGIQAFAYSSNHDIGFALQVDQGTVEFIFRFLGFQSDFGAKLFNINAFILFNGLKQLDSRFGSSPSA